MGDEPQDGKPILLNGNIFVVCGILRFVAASAAEAGLGALFINGKKIKILRLILGEMGHPQPPTPVHCDNKTATSIVNDAMKKTDHGRWKCTFFESLIRFTGKFWT